MGFKKKLESVQAHLTSRNIAGWLLYNYRCSNPLAIDFLDISDEKSFTRRFCYWVPCHGEPIKIVSSLEPFVLDHLPGTQCIYNGREEFEASLAILLKRHKIVAMEYSHNNALPNISKVDAGTIEFVRSHHVEVVSSADILQYYSSVWTDEQVKSHFSSAKILDKIVSETWGYIKRYLKKEEYLDEYMVQQFMLQLIQEASCLTDNPPTCAVNRHSADPHYHPNPKSALPIRKNDFILLDLWCKENKAHSVYADITRVGVAAESATEKQKMIFYSVKQARDTVTEMIKESHQQGVILQGWQADKKCRDCIEQLGFGKYFIHRTGHNLGKQVHGPGANLDNFETHDYRQLLAGTAFTIEPGIYLPNEFGVRLEYDIYLEPGGPVHITGGIQEELMHF